MTARTVEDVVRALHDGCFCSDPPTVGRCPREVQLRAAVCAGIELALKEIAYRRRISECFNGPLVRTKSAVFATLNDIDVSIRALLEPTKEPSDE